MGINLRVFLIICVLVYLAVIVQLLRKKKLNLRYTLIWIFAAAALLFMAIFPNVIVSITHLLGINLPSNFIFIVEGIFVLVILLSLTSIVSHLSNRILQLIQTQALLEKRVRDLESRLNKEDS